MSMKYYILERLRQLQESGSLPSCQQQKLLPLPSARALAFVGGLYAPSLMIGAAVGAVFGGCAGELINSAIPGNAAVAEPQAYALVGMAATLASVCSVPLTSVLLLFELTKDYRILLPLMGAVGLAIWVPSVTAPPTEAGAMDAKNTTRGYSVVSPTDDKTDDPRLGDTELSVISSSSTFQPIDIDFILENLKVSNAMSSNYLKVYVSQTVREALICMRDGQQRCVLVVDAEDHLEGILTHGDIRRFLSRRSGDPYNSNTGDVRSSTISSILSRGARSHGAEGTLLVCYADTDLAMAKQLMEAKGIKQLPVIRRVVEGQRERKRTLLAILYYDSIWDCLRNELSRRNADRDEKEEDAVVGHQ